ncbi:MULTISPECIES: bifunctional precorrin-2 dehydrogenase/sirohydrochlorin ferrochelatase [unclassified Adlercreutzia]|uniref:precorrin-2 dehydrogenase/sirohydrochlorin ferrochelatase family protein n=1 Tax=unclassified Adlercreutzia TaxID=2636013 RepID=UPI0013EB0459|nr:MULTISPECIES: bifunctional precorrin-2 dehydrogenase/sirohydrochlorin ferrochelatase [unclassified Adlercreutzia]
MSRLYPVMLVLEDKRALVVGGGAVAQRKVEGLLACDAQVRVVAPKATDGLRALAEAGACAWCARTFCERDLADADIVFAATDDEQVNRQVFEGAKRARLMVNVADRPELCTFYLPSVMRKGRLSVSVSTEGASPLLARRVRAQIEERLSDAYAPYVDLLASYRDVVNATIAEKARMRFWEEATDGRALALVEAGDLDGAAALVDALVARYQLEREDAGASPDLT